MKEENMDVIIMDMGHDIKGETSTPGFENKIELLSFSHGDATDRTSGRRDYKDMTVSKYLDTVSPVLHRGSLEGKVFPRVDIIVGRNDPGRVSVLLRYTMKDVLISSVSVSGGAGDLPVETLTLNYNSITWDYSLG
jgi:type VI secretion system secreted protein Hcp